MKIVFVNKSMLNNGGMPSELRSLAAGVEHLNRGEVFVVADARNVEVPFGLEGINIIHAPSTKSILQLSLDKFSEDDIFVFVEFSSLYNVALAGRLRRRKIKYTVMPTWQVHDFLDWDNPFEKNLIPSIENVVAGHAAVKNRLFSRVRSGRITPLSVLQAMRRKLYRKTLGKVFLNGAEVIHVFSSFEREMIENLVGPSHSRFRLVNFGSNVQGRPIGDDTFPNSSVINLVFWGRADYYYKGIDRMLRALSLAYQQNADLPLKLWIVGPDYNGGYEAISRESARLDLRERVQIVSPGCYTPGTVGLLKCADICIAFPRWDGFSRALRESLCLGVPVLTNRETHFDSIVSNFGNGIIFDDIEDLAEIFLNIAAVGVNDLKRTAALRQGECIDFFKWKSVAERFFFSLFTGGRRL